MIPNKICEIFASFFIIIVVAFLAVVGKWTFIDRDPSDIQYVHSKLLTDFVVNRTQITEDIEVTNVKRGQQYWRYVEFCINKRVPGFVVQKFVDGIIFGMPSIPNRGYVGCWKKSFPVNIPHSLPRGDYKLETSIRYLLNPLRIVDSQKQIVNLTVVE